MAAVVQAVAKAVAATMAVAAEKSEEGLRKYLQEVYMAVAADSMRSLPVSPLLNAKEVEDLKAANAKLEEEKTQGLFEKNLAVSFKKPASQNFFSRLRCITIFINHGLNHFIGPCWVV